MKSAYFISEEKNKIFLGQRLKALKTKFNLLNFDSKKKIETENILLFTRDDKSIKKINNLINKNYKKKIILVDVIHSGHLSSQNFPKNKFQFFIQALKLILKIYVKLLKFFRKNKYLHKISIEICYIFVTSRTDRFKLPFNSRNILILSKPFFQTSPRKSNIKLKIKKNERNFLYYFDSHFPLHPDSCKEITIYKKKIIIKKMLKIYIDYLSRNIFRIYKNYNIAIFLHPRTYGNFKKIKFLSHEKHKLKKIKIFSGFDDFKNHFYNFKEKDIFMVQYGTQLSLLKSTYLRKKKNKLNLLELDKKFINDFKYLKNSFNDHQNL